MQVGLEVTSIAIVEYLKNSNHITLGLNIPQSSVRFVSYKAGAKNGELSTRGPIGVKKVHKAAFFPFNFGWDYPDYRMSIR
ncbi:hypothetical protein J1TS3_16460 [Siminovitchia fordii]|uniref:Uncharacterized protein n=1 Tax=Siminovitchia fordii TaxID=254759 RepID=A0ABQ4K444_9BACI|nr:hypothetical protein J1TS3_16460 [Siminovitchia fordii]